MCFATVLGQQKANSTLGSPDPSCPTAPLACRASPQALFTQKRRVLFRLLARLHHLKMGDFDVGNA